MCGICVASSRPLVAPGWPARPTPLHTQVLLLSGCGLLWGVKLTECLALYEPLLIIPLMLGTYILFGGLAVRAH